MTGPVEKKNVDSVLVSWILIGVTDSFVVLCFTDFRQLSKMFLSFAFENDLSALQLQVLILKDQLWMYLLPYFWGSLILKVLKTLCDVSAF